MLSKNVDLQMLKSKYEQRSRGILQKNMKQVFKDLYKPNKK